MSLAVPLPARLDVGRLALASVRAVCTAARHPAVDVSGIDPERIAFAYRSDRWLRIDDVAPDVWSPLSGFWRASDAWIRTHGNYPHHADALRTALALTPGSGSDEIATAVSGLSAAEAVTRITAAGGLAVPVLREDPRSDAALRRSDLVETIRLGDAPRRGSVAGMPLDGIRVLDLTRVIAGPVCTRTLALLGADVLRVDPPQLAEPEWQHYDTGHGKRTTVLDARSERFAALLQGADVVVLGYRPSSLDRLHLSPEAIARRRPGAVIAQLSAWGPDRPDRRGFDSLVQAESGIAWIESSDGERPGALPAQALDHSAGYLLAAGVLNALHRQRHDGGTLLVRTSLRRVAAELLGMPRHPEPQPERAADGARHTQRFRVDGHDVVTVRSVIPGVEYSAPRPWGQDPARW